MEKYLPPYSWLFLFKVLQFYFWLRGFESDTKEFYLILHAKFTGASFLISINWAIGKRWTSKFNYAWWPNMCETWVWRWDAGLIPNCSIFLHLKQLKTVRAGLNQGMSTLTRSVDHKSLINYYFLWTSVKTKSLTRSSLWAKERTVWI